MGDWNCANSELQNLGAKLGADVPVFVYGRNAIGEGIGERLTALDLPPAWYLVLTPQVSVSTKEIFESALTRSTKRLKIPPFLSGQGANDLEAAVVARYPDVAAGLAWLRKHRPQARMTGSGACLFAEFETEAEARALHAALPVAGCAGSSLGGWSDTRCSMNLTHTGESPSWLRQRILIPPYEGSNPSSPATNP